MRLQERKRTVEKTATNGVAATSRKIIATTLFGVSLERSKNLRKYEAVFHSWQNEDIIEEVQNVADKKNEHYLPHHPVYKDNSTTKIRPVFDGSAKERILLR
ncbi:uncharacterized protein TNCV_652681 [Trichonephila clavipes]|nr:uncharacterized protein TNCV_652681 [Trichonephila clavipes]